jgi:GAF domain-containing protein
MSATDRLSAAAAAGVLASEEAYRDLLQSIVGVARAIFEARASSIFLLDEETDELVFEAVAGEGSGTLVGRRFSSSTGIAGWVLVSRQPLVIDDVTQDPRFARDVAQRTGYVPKALMAVPLLRGERALGVLQVLDRRGSARSSLEQMDLLGLFANQAAIGLDLLLRGRRARAALEGTGEEAGLVARLAATVEALPEERRPAGVRLLAALAEALGAKETGAEARPGSEGTS